MARRPETAVAFLLWPDGHRRLVDEKIVAQLLFVQTKGLRGDQGVLDLIQMEYDEAEGFQIRFDPLLFQNGGTYRVEVRKVGDYIANKKAKGETS